MMKMVKMKGNMRGWDDEDGGREGDERDICIGILGKVHSLVTS